MKSDKLIFWFEEIGRERNNPVGKKCANLGVMCQMGSPIPPDFAISVDLYRRSVQEIRAIEEISRYVKGLSHVFYHIHRLTMKTVYENLWG